MIGRRRQTDGIQLAAEHGRELAGTVLGQVSDLRHDHSSTEYRSALMVAFFSAGMVCNGSHADNQAEVKAFAIAFTDELRSVTHDSALHFEDQ